MLLHISFMFEKLTKKFTTKATDNVKKTLNDRIDEYGDIIKIGLVISVIVLGGKHLTKKNNQKRNLIEPYSSQNMLPGNQPIIINNYYTREREETRNERRERRESRTGTSEKSIQPRHGHKER